jgi:hypothetical protein
VIPGDSPGTLQIQGILDAKAGEMLFQIGRTSSGVNADEIDVTGSATLGGEAKVQFVDGFQPTAGFTLDLLNAASLSGTFSVLDLPPGYTLQSNGSSLTGTYTPVPEPLPGPFAASFGLGLLARNRWRRRGSRARQC